MSIRAFALPISMFSLALVSACTGKGDTSGHTFDSDTAGVCGRVRGATGILLYDDLGDTLHAPTDAPSTTTKTTGVAGPVGGPTGMAAVYGGNVLISSDTGCNWTEAGGLPARGDWALVAAGDRVYAFDRASGSGAWSDDLGDSWTPFDTSQPFVDTPTWDGANRLRGIQTRGVVTSEDGGATWTLAGTPPFSPSGGSVSPTNLDVVVIAGEEGLAISHTGGATFEDISTTLVGIESGPVAGLRAVTSPADDNVIFAITDATDGTRTIQRSVDGGASWDRQGDSTQITIGDDARLYPMPMDSTMVLSSSFVAADNKMNLYRITAGDGIHSVGVGGYTTMQQIAIMDDRWVAAVSAVP